MGAGVGEYESASDTVLFQVDLLELLSGDTDGSLDNTSGGEEQVDMTRLGAPDGSAVEVESRGCVTTEQIHLPSRARPATTVLLPTHDQRSDLLGGTCGSDAVDLGHHPTHDPLLAETENDSPWSCGGTTLTCADLGAVRGGGNRPHGTGRHGRGEKCAFHVLPRTVQRLLGSDGGDALVRALKHVGILVF